MPQLIAFPGLDFYVVELQGTLTYTHTGNGKKARTYPTFDGADLDKGSSSDTSSDEGEKKLKPGFDASAVGVKLRLIKNDGVLKMEYKGDDGGAAVWMFHGLPLIYGPKLAASAATQTEVDSTRCSTCGEETRGEKKWK
jgi:hypothetical protein